MDNLLQQDAVQSSFPQQKSKGKDGADCKGDCGNCLQGGLPIKREFLSFLTLMLLACVVVLSVLFISAKRENLTKPAVQSALVSSPSPYP